MTQYRNRGHFYHFSLNFPLLFNSHQKSLKRMTRICSEKLSRKGFGIFVSDKKCFVMFVSKNVSRIICLEKLIDVSDRKPEVSASHDTGNHIFDCLGNCKIWLTEISVGLIWRIIWDMRLHNFKFQIPTAWGLNELKKLIYQFYLKDKYEKIKRSWYL